MRNRVCSFCFNVRVFPLKAGIVQAQDAVLNVVGGRPAHSEEGMPGQLK